jgi:glycosyltransferase involved in cell wall biosynthesis
MRILLLTHYFSTHGGGVEIVAWQVGRRLAREHNAHLTWLASGVDPLPDAPELACLPLPAWNPLERRFGLPYPLLKPAAVAAIWRAVGRCDVVHVHECQYLHSLLAALFCRLRGRRFVVTQHVGEIEYRSPLKRAALALLNRIGARLVLDCADSVLFVSAKVMAFFMPRMAQPGRALQVDNGVDTDMFAPRDADTRASLRRSLGLPPAGPLVAFAGRFVEKKGLHLLQALARCEPQITFALAGQGPIEPRAWRLSNVRPLGMCDATQLAALFGAADLLCIPSFGEGFPLVVQEAMACGCPPLLDVAVAEGGRLPPGLAFTADVLAADAVDALHARLQEALLEDADARAARRAAVARFARQRWSWARCAAVHAQALQAACRAGTAHG